MFAASKTASVSGGYQISRSLRFNSADSAYVARTPSVASNRRTYTWSGWVKKNTDSSDRRIFEAGASSANVFWIGFGPAGSTDQFIVQDYTGSFQIQLASTAVYRDPSAWYHVVVAVDTTQATSTDRVKIYINGVQITSFVSGNATFPSQNYETRVNQSVVHDIGGSSVIGGSAYFNGYMTEVNFIDGQALTPSSFGNTDAQTGVWGPKAYSGSYGTNGFYLNFSDNSNTTAATLGKDYSGNGNNWTPNNFSVTAGAGNDSLVDSPTSYGVDTGVGGTVRGNYCTLNPLAKKNAVTFANGNLDAASVTSADICYSTMGVSSGKWYWEVTCISGVHMIGISKDVFPITDWQTINGLAYYSANGQKYTNGAGSAYGATFTNSDVIGLALDMDAGTLVFYKNGTTQGTAFTGITGTYFASVQNAGANGTMAFNFGQRPFAYTAPSGFKALNTQNLPTPTIGATTATQAGKFFNPVLWSGDDANPRTITGVGFQPDWVWVKGRNAAVNHFLQDAVRGVTSSDTRSLISNSTDIETNYYAGNGGVTAFSSDGFTTSGGSANANLNLSGRTFVAWNWKANGSGSSNTAGSITSTVSANTTSGFSVVTYTGTGANATVGHGLGVAPAMYIVKKRNATSDWGVYHQGIGATNVLQLQASDAVISIPTWWNSTAPTSTVFSLGSSSNMNGNGSDHVAYCFAPVAGYSAFGSYTGNGSTDGPFVFTGFRPAYVMWKRTDVANDWVIVDTTRSAINQTANVLYANSSVAEDTGTGGSSMDILSNGFKVRTTNNGINASGGAYVFMAFASAPQKFALAR